MVVETSFKAARHNESAVRWRMRISADARAFNMRQVRAPTGEVHSLLSVVFCAGLYISQGPAGDAGG